MNRLSPDRRKGVKRLRGGDGLGDGGQRGQVLVDRAQAGTHRVHRHVRGARRCPLGQFIGGLTAVTTPGDPALHAERRRIPARRDRRLRHDVACFVELGPR
jgi:hypothetical protein